MEYTYVSIFRFEGISWNAQDKIIADDKSRGLVVLISNNVDEHCLELDTSLACASMLLRGMFNEKKFKDLPTAIQEEKKLIREQRQTNHKNGAYIVIKIKGSADIHIDEKLHNETEDFHVCFDAANKDALKTQHRNTVESVVSSLSFVTNPDYRAVNVIDGIYFRDDNGKLLFTYTMEGGRVRVIASKSFDDRAIQSASELIKVLANDTGLKSVLRLFAESVETTQDDFRAFLSAWSAIEIFVNKMFSSYEKRFITNVATDHDSPGVNKFLVRIQTVMKDKYRLADKFTLIASFLSDDIEKDIILFNTIKGLRDDIYHGKIFDEESLPVEETRHLVSIYVKKHLNFKGIA